MIANSLMCLSAMSMACSTLAQTGTPPGAPVQSSAEDCAIFAAIAEGELIRNDAGAIPLPEPKPSLQPVKSRAERHAAYLEKLKGWKPEDVDSYETWILQEGWRLEQFKDLPGFYIQELVTEDGKARPAYNLTCDWEKQGITFDPDEKQPNQWLTFTRPFITRDGEYALVHISYGYTNTHARDTSCVLQKQEGGWKFLECRASLMS